jgi:hypothetical protein
MATTCRLKGKKLSKLFKLSSKINCNIKKLYPKLNLLRNVASKGQLSNLINHF